MEPATLKQLIGQRLAVGFDGYEIPEDFKSLVKEYKVGNVILFRRNCRDHAQLRALCNALRELITAETGEQPFIMLDEECGNVSRLAHIATPTPSAMAIGATDDPDCAYAIGRLIGEELRSVGVNFNLAPVLDVTVNPNNPVIGTRSFGFTAEEVARMGCAYMKGLQSTGVFACGKHFPGHGDTDMDSHIALPVIDKPAEEVRRVELAPFRAAIEAGVDGIMSAHCIFPAFEPEHKPATVSRRVMTDLLRGELGFKGLVISDGMEMQAVMSLYGIENGVYRALCAGVDIALVCHSAKQAADTMDYCMQAFADGCLDEHELHEHYEQILTAKKRLPSGPDGSQESFGSEAQKAVAREVMRKALCFTANGTDHAEQLSASTIFYGAKARRQSLANDAENLDAAQVLAKHRGARFIADPFACEAELTGAARSGASIAAFFTTNDDRLGERIALTNRLAEAGGRITVIAMTTPFLLDRLSEKCRKLCTYGYDSFTVAVLDEIL